MHPLIILLEDNMKHLYFSLRILTEEKFGRMKKILSIRQVGNCFKQAMKNKNDDLIAIELFGKGTTFFQKKNMKEDHQRIGDGMLMAAFCNISVECIYETYTKHV